MTIAKRKHIVIITIPYFGHIIPAIGLARNLSQNAKVTFAALRGSLAHIRARGELTVQDEKTFDVLAIEDDFPEGIAEADYMKKMLGRVKDYYPHIAKFVSAIAEGLDEVGAKRTPVDAFIADMLLTMPLSQSNRLGIPYFLFHTANTENLQDILHVTEHTPVCDASISILDTFFMVRSESEGPQFPLHPSYKNFSLSIKNNLGKETGILVNSCLELEEDGIQRLQSNHLTKQGRFYCVGPFMPSDKAEQPDELLLKTRVAAWLDSKPLGSVVYISFGSLAQLSEGDVKQVGKALENLQKPFILSLKETLQQYLPLKLEVAISSQFNDTNSQGLVLKWAPQKTILAHPSVQMFVSHCGWNSTIESIYFGKPVVGWPMFADQLEDALILEKIGMGVSLHTVESSGVAGGQKSTVSAEDIVDAVARIGASNGQTGVSTFTETAQKWSGKLKAAIGPDGTSQGALKRLLEGLYKESAF